MSPRSALAWLVLGACGGSPPKVATPAPPSAPCLPLPDDAGTPRAGFALAHDYREVRVYRLGPGGCGALVARFDPEGRYAFGWIGEPKLDGMPDLGIETWLMHGDRRHQTFTWSGSQYIAAERAVLIPGPRR